MYLHAGWVDLTEIWNGMSYPKGHSTEKLVQFHSGIIELQMHENSIFLVPV